MNAAARWIRGRPAGRLDAAVLASSLVTVLAVLALVQRGGVMLASLLPVLIGAGAICGALLVRTPAPSLAWLGLVAGSLAAASVPFARSRAAEPASLGIEPWTWIAVQSAAAALLTMLVAVGYAARSEPRPVRGSRLIAIGAVAWLTIACTTTVGLIVTGEARPDPAFTWVDAATAPLTWFLHAVLIVVALGVAADVRAGTGRALAREPVVAGPWTAARIRALAIATLGELTPGRTAAQDASADAERTRLAGDLHAVVLPGLRRAIAEAESGGDPDALARRLRSIDLELERLMADRWPVVLEAFGLVAALEDLAERIEADSRLAVQIDVERAGERPPPAIERAAWRIAQIAIDNAARHAAATLVSIAVSVDPERLSLVVADDGRGFDATAAAGRVGARGLADASRRADEVGAIVRIDRRPSGGTTVRFDWAVRRP